MSTPVPKTVWSRIYDDVKMQIPGVTDAVFKQMLAQVWGDFTDRTNIWIEECPFNVSPSSLTYTITLTKFGEPHRLMVVYDQASSPPSRNWVQSGIEMYKPGVITLKFEPTAGTWVAVIAKNYNEIDDNGYPKIHVDDEWIVDKYGDGLHYGVLGRLQMMPVKPFTNLKLGAQNWQVYIAERGLARSNALKANVYGGQRWMFPQSFATVTRKGWV